MTTEHITRYSISIMRTKMKKKPHVHNYFHLTYLLYLPLIFILVMYMWAISVRTAREQIKTLADIDRFEEATLRQGNITYRVQAGDTIDSVAMDFNISPDTIRWANENLYSDELIVDSIIIIPPITGVVHIVKHGESVESIARKYKANPDAIRNYRYNRFSDDVAFPLIVGEPLYIPGGVK